MKFEEAIRACNQDISKERQNAGGCIEKLKREGFFAGLTGLTIEVGAGQCGVIKDLVGGQYKGFDLFYSNDFIEEHDWAWRADMHELTIPDESVDNLLTFNALEHSICPFLAFTEMKRVLKKGGNLYILFPAFCEGWESDLTHWWVPSDASLKSYLARFGFEVKRFDSFPEDQRFVWAVKK